MGKGWMRQRGCHCHICRCGELGLVPIQDHGSCGGVAPSPTGFSGSFGKRQIQLESDWFVQRLYLPGEEKIIIIILRKQFSCFSPELCFERERWGGSWAPPTLLLCCRHAGACPGADLHCGF